jgi:hypothetical protein
MIGALSLIAALGADAASEANAGLRLQFSAPRSCPDRDELWRAYREHAAGSARTETLVEARVVIVRRADGSFSAELHTKSQGRDGQRALHAPRCEELLEALALVLAMTVSEQARLEPEATPRPVAGVDAPRAPPRLRPTVGAELGASTGTLPSLSPFGRVRLELSRARLALMATGLYAQHQDQRLGTEAQSVHWQRAELGLFGCARFWGEESRGPRALGCAGALLSLLRAASRGIAEPGQGDASFVRAGAELALRFPSPWPRVELGASLLGAYAVATPAFAVRGVGTVFDPPSWSLDLGLGAAYRFE